MLLGIALNFLGTLGIIGQFFLENLIKERKSKRPVRLLLVLVAIFGLWGSYYIQEQDNKNLSVQLQEISKTNIELKAILTERDKDIKAVREQNDELKIMLAELKKQQEEFIILSEASAKEISRSREVIEDISNKSFTRGISNIDKIKMVSILKQKESEEITITSVMGDSESLQFASQIKEVFAAAGWEVHGVNQALYSTPVKGLRIKVKSREYPARVREIVQSINVLRLKIEGRLDEDLGPQDVELIVGTK